MGLSYIDKLWNDEDCPITLTRFNVHRLLVISLMVAAKFYEDFYIDNDSWAQIAGLQLQEINKLERKFLAYINFGINTGIDWFMNYIQLVLTYAVENEVVPRDVARQLLRLMVDTSVNELREGGADQ